MNNFDRRDFLKFMGITAYSLSSASMLSTLTSCNANTNIQGIKATFADELRLAKGLNYYPIISWGDQINSSEKFGFNNDYISVIPKSSNELIMWVNHEYVNPIFVGGWERTKENIDREMLEIGGSILEVKKENNKWTFQKNGKLNRRITGKTKIPFANGTKVLGQDYAIGTSSNCAGGQTPWKTFLTCEENYNYNYGERDENGNIVTPKFSLDWFKAYNHPPEHYGWIVEVDPQTGKAQKHTNLGRFAHECATCVMSKSGNVVVYSGDDKADEHVYKFISKNGTDFKEGTLYVADTKNGKWLALDLEKSPILKEHFKTQTDVMINARKASKILGATELDRPEDVERNPITGDIFVSLTNNYKKGRPHGSILKISEQDSDHNSLNFKAETFLLGGQKGGLTCPDNLAFDRSGNLWVCNDIAGWDIGKKHYKPFGNNGLFVIPAKGESAGKVIQVASAPVDAELTGLCFSPDYQTLFLSVQHPGETSESLDKLTSSWPTGNTPKSTVVAIEGQLLKDLKS